MTKLLIDAGCLVVGIVLGWIGYSRWGAKVTAAEAQLSGAVSQAKKAL